MPFCKYCGGKVDIDSKFCHSCGRLIEREPEPQEVYDRDAGVGKGYDPAKDMRATDSIRVPGEIVLDPNDPGRDEYEESQPDFQRDLEAYNSRKREQAERERLEATYRESQAQSVEETINAPSQDVPWFWRLIGSCLWSKYFAFAGRATRREFWYFFLFLFLCFIGLVFIMPEDSEDEKAMDRYFTIETILFLGLFTPWVAVTMRRFHDVGLSALWFWGGNILQVLGFALLATMIAMGEGTEEAPPTIDPSIATAFMWLGTCVYFGAFGAIVVVTLWPGEPRTNRYGADPYGREELRTIFREPVPVYNSDSVVYGSVKEVAVSPLEDIDDASNNF